MRTYIHPFYLLSLSSVLGCLLKGLYTGSPFHAFRSTHPLVLTIRIISRPYYKFGSVAYMTLSTASPSPTLSHVP